MSCCMKKTVHGYIPLYLMEIITGFLYAGSYSVKFSAQGYLTEVINNVSVTNRQATILNVELVPEGVGGIDNNEISKMIRIYPNPVKEVSLAF